MVQIDGLRSQLFSLVNEGISLSSQIQNQLNSMKQEAQDIASVPTGVSGSPLCGASNLFWVCLPPQLNGKRGHHCSYFGAKLRNDIVDPAWPP